MGMRDRRGLQPSLCVCGIAADSLRLPFPSWTSQGDSFLPPNDGASMLPSATSPTASSRFPFLKPR